MLIRECQIEGILTCANAMRLDGTKNKKWTRRPGMLLPSCLNKNLDPFATEVHSPLANMVDISRTQSPETRCCYWIIQPRKLWSVPKRCAKVVVWASSNLNGRCAATMGPDRRLIVFFVETLDPSVKWANIEDFDLHDRYANTTSSGEKDQCEFTSRYCKTIPWGSNDPNDRCTDISELDERTADVCRCN